MSFSDYVLPILIVFLLAYSVIKKQNAYNSFTLGAKKSLPLALKLFAYVAAMFMVLELMKASGLTELLCVLFAPLLSPLGIPKELMPLVIIKSFSGSGSLAVLQNVYAQYGADSYIGRCASIIMGTSETVFYICAVYFAGTKVRNVALPVAVSLVGSFVSILLACLICRIM